MKALLWLGLQMGSITIEADGMQQGLRIKADNRTTPALYKLEDRNSCTQLPFFYFVQGSSKWDNVMHVQGKPFLFRYIVLETTSQTHPEECQHDNSLLISLKHKHFTWKNSIPPIVPKISVSISSKTFCFISKHPIIFDSSSMLPNSSLLAMTPTVFHAPLLS